MTVTEFFEWSAFFKLEARYQQISQERAERKARLANKGKGR